MEHVPGVVDLIKSLPHLRKSVLEMSKKICLQEEKIKDIDLSNNNILANFEIFCEQKENLKEEIDTIKSINMD